MITKKMVIEFHKQRLESTAKIIETLRELKKTNLTTHLIDCEIEMQEGERDFTIETLSFLQQEDNEDNVIVLGEKKGNEVRFRIKECDPLNVLDRVKKKVNVLDHRSPSN
ncbi:hypothetical protein [Chryseobacterium indologenes]|uniref:Uncharacterized protein n=1 Tax=Chryseobacterium indologenes TaxID=253 RepID=A0A0N0ZTN5_CHRID|nr:hypothetical protein [Chryseobacterium indologenes]KPE49758.1 hypothetical protein AOB46_18715 [Chryseobacterium indologenes]